DHHHHVSITPITSTILIGDLASSYSIPTLIRHGVTAIVSLGLSPSLEWSRPGNLKLVPEKNHLFVVCDDSSTEDILVHLADICDFIDEQTAEPSLEQILQQAEEESVLMGCTSGSGYGSSSGVLSLTQRGKVLVHCSQGVSRSPTVVIAYLMRKQKKGLRTVLADVKMKRREVDPCENFLEQLKIWEEVKYDIWEDKARKVPKKRYRQFLEKRAARERAE
ncbi:protein-tyrosine phosphatase-like protein, partial [Cercophora newfieldiana]